MGSALVRSIAPWTLGPLRFVLIVSAASLAAGASQAQTLDIQQKLELIEGAADRICNIVSAKGEADSSEVKGSVNAQLSGLAAALGVSGDG